MSTRTRIILTSANDGFVYGPNARQHLLANARPPYLPVDWSSIPMWKKLMWLARYLPRPMKCQVFREPRGTKATRSLYWKALRELGVGMPKKRRRVPDPGNPFMPPPRRPVQARRGGLNLEDYAAVPAPNLPPPPPDAIGWNVVPGAPAPHPAQAQMLDGMRDAMLYGIGQFRIEVPPANPEPPARPRRQ